jgi:hypothetical protein
MKAAYAGAVDRKQLCQSELFGFHERAKGGEELVFLVRDLFPDNTFYQSQPPKDPNEDDDDEEDDEDEEEQEEPDIREPDE